MGSPLQVVGEAHISLRSMTPAVNLWLLSSEGIGGEDMEAIWDRGGGGIRYLPQIVWIIVLALLTAILGLNLMGWMLVAVMAFLIYPRFWEGRTVRGLGPGVRVVIPTLFTVLLAYGAWNRLSEGGDMLGSVAKEMVASNLRDPSSAEFRNILAGSDATCGEVNAKNAFGAYAGFKHFVLVDGKVLFEPEQPVVPDVERQTAYFNAVAEFARGSQHCFR